MSSGKAWDPSPERVGQLFGSSVGEVSRARLYVADAAFRRGWSSDELVDVLGALGLSPEQEADDGAH